LVRNLLVGPQRFSDLSAGLPGLSTALLAGRLKALEAAGVVTKGRLPPPAASSVYELTDEGRRLAPAVLELARWGLDR
ncbi:winged helix-turn-helix transcriptional regulator, partial [Mycobacterium kansasii]